METDIILVAKVITLDCADVVRANPGDVDRERPLSAQGANSIDLLGSLKTGRLEESLVNLSMVSDEELRGRYAVRAQQVRAKVWVCRKVQTQASIYLQ